MAHITVKAEVKEEERGIWSPVTLLDTKCRRTLDDFKNFCSFILAYEASLEDSCHVSRSCDLHSCRSPSSSSTASCSSAEDSLTEDRRPLPMPKPLNNKRSHENEEYDSDDESWNAVTCYCKKPFAGRPMIECSQCLTWIHLSCAKIRKSNIPELFVCHLCRDRNPRLTNFLAHTSNSLLKHVDKPKRKSDPLQRKRPKMPKNRKRDYRQKEHEVMPLVTLEQV